MYTLDITFSRMGYIHNGLVLCKQSMKHKRRRRSIFQRCKKMSGRMLRGLLACFKADGRFYAIIVVSSAVAPSHPRSPSVAPTVVHPRLPPVGAAALSPCCAYAMEEAVRFCDFCLGFGD